MQSEARGREWLANINLRLLQSTPRFTKNLFKEIWTEIFDFAGKATGVDGSKPISSSEAKKVAA